MAFEFQQFTVVGCRLTRDPEPPKSFGQRKVIRFGIAFEGERRKGDNGQWDSKPVFMDCECWQGEFGAKLVDLMNKYAKKGQKLTVVGKLKMDEWEDKNGGGKRRAIKLNVTEIVFHDKVEDQGRDGGGTGGNDAGGSGDSGGGSGYGGTGEDPIPF